MFSITRVNARVLGGAAVAALVLGTGVGAQAAGHRKPVKKVRTTTVAYQGGCGFDVAVGGTGGSGTPGVCPVGATYTVTRKSTEKFLTIIVADQTGRPVSGSLWLKGGAGTAVAEPFCGSLKNYRMGQDTYTLDLNAAADSTCPGAPTTGKLTIKYSNLP
ncbi:MAG: hypothetical protein QOF18_2868 [Frankiaceae bacterium]|jgi:hypothetical protein|nr:hypothetical protein [Frankiaceae bacterium]